jgi:hypothetical protein
MGHRLSVVLIVLNALGFFACLMLIAANGNQTTEVAIHFTRAIQPAIRMFVIGAGLPLVAWEFAASGFDRTHATVKLVESWLTYILLVVSWLLFFIAAWLLPGLIINGLNA